MKLASLVIATCLVAGCATNAEDDTTADTAALSPAPKVNGHALAPAQETWLRYVASDVVPHLYGDRAARLTVASRASWWALKEGVWNASNPAAYSLCNGPDGDVRIGPLTACGAGKAWQVGIAGVQVPGHDVASLEVLAHDMYPDQTINQVLADAAARAGYEPGSDTTKAIVASSGTLRASWLLKVPAIGIAVVEKSEVTPECLSGNKGWCYGTKWDETRAYAPTKAGAEAAIEDIRRLLDDLSPP